MQVHVPTGVAGVNIDSLTRSGPGSAQSDVSSEGAVLKTIWTDHTWRSDFDWIVRIVVGKHCGCQPISWSIRTHDVLNFEVCRLVDIALSEIVFGSPPTSGLARLAHSDTWLADLSAKGLGNRKPLLALVCAEAAGVPIDLSNDEIDEKRKAAIIMSLHKLGLNIQVCVKRALEAVPRKALSGLSPEDAERERVRLASSAFTGKLTRASFADLLALHDVSTAARTPPAPALAPAPARRELSLPLEAYEGMIELMTENSRLTAEIESSRREKDSLRLEAVRQETRAEVAETAERIARDECAKEVLAANKQRDAGIRATKRECTRGAEDWRTGASLLEAKIRELEKERARSRAAWAKREAVLLGEQNRAAAENEAVKRALTNRIGTLEAEAASSEAKLAAELALRHAADEAARAAQREARMWKRLREVAKKAEQRAGAKATRALAAQAEANDRLSALQTALAAKTKLCGSDVARELKDALKANAQLEQKVEAAREQLRAVQRRSAETLRQKNLELKAAAAEASKAKHQRVTRPENQIDVSQCLDAELEHAQNELAGCKEAAAQAAAAWKATEQQLRAEVADLRRISAPTAQQLKLNRARGCAPAHATACDV